MQLNLPRLQAEARHKQDIKATKTVAIAVVTFFACYILVIIFSILPRDAIHPWLTFLAVVCSFMSSASNPIIYVLRNRRYRTAIRQLVKDPCGRSPFQERPVTNGKGKKRNPQVKAQRLAEEKPGACARPNEDLESRAIGQVTAKSQMFQSKKTLKTAGQKEDDKSVPKQDWWIEQDIGRREKAQGYTSPSLESCKETKKYMN